MPRVTVYFATNRMPETDATGANIIDFNSELGPIDGTAVRFGSAEVDVTTRRAGMVSDSLRVAEEQLIGSKPQLGSRDIFEKLRQDMKDGGRPTLVTLHGFSNSFRDAIERAAIILNFYGIDANVFAFSWPSRRSVLPAGLPLPYVDYMHDRETARASGIAIARTMRILYDYVDRLPLREVCRQPIHLICHSMGAYALRHAVQALMQLTAGEPREYARDLSTGEPSADGPQSERHFPTMFAIPTEGRDPNRLRRTFEQIILAAADEDEDSFSDPQELKHLPRLCAGVTVYHTERDWILSTLSRYTKFNGPRLGVSGPGNMGAISDKVTAVDVSAVIDPRGDIQNHQYYRILPRVRDDIVAVLTGKRPNEIAGRDVIAAQRYGIRASASRRRRRTGTT